MGLYLNESGVLTPIAGRGDLTEVVANLSHDNLLDNPWFTVNQRGFTTLSESGLTYDRWRMTIDIGTVNATNNGVELDATSNPITFCQGREVDTGIWNGVDNYTMSVDFTVEAKGSNNMSFMVNAQGSGHLTNFITVTPEDVTVGGRYMMSGTNKLTGDISSSTAMYLAWLYLRQGWKIIIHSIKFEKGSVSTLAMDAIPNYQQELAKCQRYYQRIWQKVTTDTLCIAVQRSNTLLRTVLPLAAPMRANPTVTVSGTVSDYTNSGLTMSKISGVVENGGIIGLNFNITKSGVTWSDGEARLITPDANDFYIDISADL